MIFSGQRAVWFVAALFALAMLFVQHVWSNANFIAAYLCGWWFWLGISLGSCVHGWVYIFTGGRWGEALQPIAQSAAAQMPLLALLYLPLLIAGNAHLYSWMPMAPEKAWWLNSTFFMARSVFYLALWIVLAWLLRRTAERRVAALGLLLYGFSASFAAFDWLMSLLPEWYSTGFGLLAVSGQLLSSFAFGVVIYLRYSQQCHLATNDRQNIDVDRKQINLDFGNLLLTYVLLWAYLAYTQFLIIWAENLPHEIAWYLPRSHGFWLAIGIGLIALHFALPLFILLLRTVKKSSQRLAALALSLVIAHVFDSAWLVLPSLPHSNYLSLLLALFFTIAIGVLWLWHWRGILKYVARNREAVST